MLTSMRSSTVIRPGPTANLLSECGSGSLFLCSCIVIPHCHLGHKNKGKKKEDRTYLNKPLDGFRNVLCQFCTSYRPRRGAEIPCRDLSAPWTIALPLCIKEATGSKNTSRCVTNKVAHHKSHRYRRTLLNKQLLVSPFKTHETTV